MSHRPPDVAAAMDLAAGECVQHSVRLRRYEGRPSLLLDTYLPLGIAAQLDPEEIRNGSIQEGMRRQGILLDEVDYTVSAVSADMRLTQLLYVPLATALLSMIWVFRNDAGQVIEFQYAYGRPDSYVLQTRLRSPR